MKLTVLGSGTVCPYLRRASSSYLLEVGNAALLFDFGHGALRRFLELGHAPDRLQRIFLTHVHPDHTSDLVPLLFAINYAPGWTRERLDFYGPEGTTDLLDRVAAAWPWTGPRVYLRQVEELEQTRLEFPGFTVESFPVLHGELCALAYRVEAAGRVFCYSGDSGFCDELLDAAREADLFLCECAIPAGYPPKPEVHLTSADVGALAAHARVKNLLITHLYPQADEVDIRAEVAEHYDGPIEVAEDGRSYPV
ncbi:MAG: ribonuclease Z [Candidatus Eremiobacterota bacterium]